MNNDFARWSAASSSSARAHANWNGVVDCEVLAIDPLKQLSYSWGVGSEAAGLQWVVLWTLTPVEGGTHVRMEQSGFTPDQKGAYGGAKYGWQKFFTGLERVVSEVDQP